jgi:hypothetical protein
MRCRQEADPGLHGRRTLTPALAAPSRRQAPTKARPAAAGRAPQPSGAEVEDGGSGGGATLAPWSCSDGSLLQLVASRDPTGRGLGGVLALRLLQRLLHWDPGQVRGRQGPVASSSRAAGGRTQKNEGRC